MRSRYIVCYDISDSKRLSRVYKKMRGFGDHIQYSVFLCDLSAQEKALMIAALGELIHHKDDRIMIANIGRQGGRSKDAIEFMGKPASVDEPSATIV